MFEMIFFPLKYRNKIFKAVPNVLFKLLPPAN